MKLNLIQFCLLFLVVAAVSARNTSAQSDSATLYALNKYGNEQRDFCLNFKTGPSSSRRDPCDFAYGSLYAGNDWDWFQSSTHKTSRSIIKDLGLLTWNDQFEVPFVKPFPKLSPGEQRTVTIDVSGADGADGARGAEGAPAMNADGTIPVRPAYSAPRSTTSNPVRKKHDGKPRVDPIFVKAIVGHMYVVHVVDDANDFYALVRVEAIERGDRCTVSWKITPSPPDPTPDN